MRSTTAATIAVAHGQAIIFVCLYHAQWDLVPLGLDYLPYWWLVRALQHVVVPTFFLVSGMSMSRRFESDGTKFITSRLLAYAWIYVAWFSIYLLYDVTKQVVHIGPYETVQTFQSLPRAFRYTRNTLWFLENVIIYVALSQFIARWRSLVVITALGAQYFSFWMGWAGAERLFGMMTLFAVGFIYRPWVYKFVERPRPLIALAAVATYIVGDLYFFSWGDRNLSHDRGSLLKIAMSAVGLLWWLQIAVIFSKAPLLGPELRRVGALVLPIYLLHTLVLGVLSTLARPLTRHMNIHIASLMSLWAFGFVGIYGAVFMFKAFRRVPGVFFPPRCFFRFIDTTIERLRRAGYADNSHSRIK